MLATFFLLWLSLANSARGHVQDPPATPSAGAQVAAPELCKDPKYTQSDLNECFAKAYQDADKQLNVEYNKVVGFMKKNLALAQHDNDAALIAHNETSLTKLLAAQRAWLAYRDANCESVKFQYEGGSIQPMVWSKCMADTTQQRIATLTTAYDITN